MPSPPSRGQAFGRRIRTLYQAIVAAATLIALVVGMRFEPHTQRNLLAWPVVGLVVAPLLAFLWCRSRILPHAIPAATAREASLEPRSIVLIVGGIAAQVCFR